MLHRLGAMLLMLGLVVCRAEVHASAVAPEKADHGPAAKTDKKEAGGHGEKGHDKGPGGGLLNIRLDLTLWTIAIFVLLLLVLKKLAWGPMLEGLNKRENNIRTAAEEAHAARQETERLRAQFKAEMDAAFAKIPQFMEEARAKAAKLEEEMRSKAAAEIQAERDRLRREIELAKDGALKSIWEKGAELATQIARKVLPRTLTPEDHQRLFHVAMEEMQSSKGSRN